MGYFAAFLQYVAVSLLPIAAIKASLTSAFDRFSIHGGSWLWVFIVFIPVFVVLAWWMKGVTASGAVAGWILCLALYVFAGGGAVVALAAVFFLTWIATRIGGRKQSQQAFAENGEGRTAPQVLANVGVAALCAGLYSVGDHHPIFLLALAASLAEAAADTVSSEIGSAFGDKPRLITNWKKVAIGTDGGVTLIGSIVGLIAGCLISLVCVLGGLLSWEQFAIPAGSAFLGMLADSYMGALFERRHLLNNNSVNFLGTLLAAFLAFVASR